MDMIASTALVILLLLSTITTTVFASNLRLSSSSSSAKAATTVSAAKVNGRLLEESAVSTYVSPEFRWIVYEELTEEQMIHVTDLEYTNTTWNILNTNPIEKLAFVDLPSDQQEAATQLGFVEGTWDCDQNHYGGYYWSSLETYNLDTYWIALGWNQSSWEGLLIGKDDDGDDAYYYPATNEMYWTNLTQAQQDAAWELCYFQESWDMIPMSDWYSDEEYNYYDASTADGNLTDTNSSTAEGNLTAPDALQAEGNFTDPDAAPDEGAGNNENQEENQEDEDEKEQKDKIEG